jgi:hypothetical protein
VSIESAEVNAAVTDLRKTCRIATFAYFGTFSTAAIRGFLRQATD